MVAAGRTTREIAMYASNDAYLETVEGLPICSYDWPRSTLQQQHETLQSAMVCHNSSMRIRGMTDGDYAWWPHPDVVETANLTRFMHQCGVADYDDLLAWDRRAGSFL